MNTSQTGSPEEKKDQNKKNSKKHYEKKEYYNFKKFFFDSKNQSSLPAYEGLYQTILPVYAAKSLNPDLNNH